ncbi:uncharacterized protein VP01_14615g1, partial [Puccinia sorghi]
SQGELSSNPIVTPCATVAKTSINALLFHNLSPEALKKTCGTNALTVDCRACCLSKSTLLPVSKTFPTPTRILEYVYMELSGKLMPPMLGGVSTLDARK